MREALRMGKRSPSVAACTQASRSFVSEQRLRRRFERDAARNHDGELLGGLSRDGEGCDDRELLGGIWRADRRSAAL
jgi:hypothetical protein